MIVESLELNEVGLKISLHVAVTRQNVMASGEHRGPKQHDEDKSRPSQTAPDVCALLLDVRVILPITS